MTHSSTLETITAAVVLSAVTLAAQSTSPPNIAPPQGEQRQPAATAEEMKVTGCLSAAANAGAAAGETNSAAKFLLTTMPATEKSEVTKYALQPEKPDLKLESYAGRKVEITAHTSGTADSLSQPQSNAGVSPSQPGGSTGMETIPPPTGRTLLVSAVRVIASSCQ